MSLTTAMSVRLPDDLKKRVEKVADAARLKPSDLIRMAVEEYCNEVERSGKITISYDPKKKP